MITFLSDERPVQVFYEGGHQGYNFTPCGAEDLGHSVNIISVVDLDTEEELIDQLDEKELYFLNDKATSDYLDRR